MGPSYLTASCTDAGRRGRSRSVTHRVTVTLPRRLTEVKCRGALCSNALQMAKRRMPVELNFSRDFGPHGSPRKCRFSQPRSGGELYHGMLGAAAVGGSGETARLQYCRVDASFRVVQRRRRRSLGQALQSAVHFVVIPTYLHPLITSRDRVNSRSGVSQHCNSSKLHNIDTTY